MEGIELKTLNVGDRVRVHKKDGIFEGVVKSTQIIETFPYSWIHTRELVKPLPPYQRALVESVKNPLNWMEARVSYFIKVGKNEN